MFFAAWLWVPRLVVTLTLGREEKQLPVGLMQPRARSWRDLHIYLSMSACTPAAQSQAELSTHKRNLWLCHCYLCPEPQPKTKPSQCWWSNLLWERMGWNPALPIWGSTWSLTHCHQPLLTAHDLSFWHKRKVWARFPCVLFWPCVPHLNLGSWTRKQVCA